MTAKPIRKIIISRTDAIGDVMLTLPIAAWIKKYIGETVEVVFFGRQYTIPVLRCCSAIDAYLDYDVFKNLGSGERVNFLKECKADAIIHVFPRKEIAVAAGKSGIPLRIGTTNRIFHWWTCNKLIRLGRKNSLLHEVELNATLLKGIGIKEIATVKDTTPPYRFSRIPELPYRLSELFDSEKFKLVIHPKSNASAREWSLEHYQALIEALPKNRFQVIITGGETDKIILDDWVQQLPEGVLNLSGQLTLDELIAVLNYCDGIVAASTGPLHIAAALGKNALGLYPPIRPMHPGRWRPLGDNSSFLVVDKKCSACVNTPATCTCMNEISPGQVKMKLLQWLK